VISCNALDSHHKTYLRNRQGSLTLVFSLNTGINSGKKKTVGKLVIMIIGEI